MQANLDQIISKSLNKPGYVYLLQDKHEFKIGRTKNLKQRLRNLCTGNPHILLVDYVIWKDMFYLEQYLHKRFETYRLPTSEYFVLTVEHIDWLKQLFTKLEQTYHATKFSG